MSLVIKNRVGKASRTIATRVKTGRVLLDTNGQMGELYGHTVVIQIGGMTIRNEAFDCEFDIPFDDDAEANEAELIIYNLSDNTIGAIKQDSPITVTAGYGTDTGVVFSGFVSKVKSCYSDTDRVTQVYALDSTERKEQELESISYAPGTAASFILKDLVSRLGLPLAVCSIKRDYVYKDGATADGGLMDNIRKQAQVCGVSAYICKSQIYIRHITEGDILGFSLSSETGLLTLNEFAEEQTAEDFIDTVTGCEMTLLLQHRITTASLLKVQSKNVSGTFRVREGSHVYDGTDFLTKVKAIACLPEPQPEAEAQKDFGLPDLSGYSGVSIVDGLKSAGMDSSFAFRKALAEKLGIQAYSGTAAQNLEMLRKLGGKVG